MRRKGLNSFGEQFPPRGERGFKDELPP